MPFFPPSGGSDFTGYPVQYVDPNGSNSNPGTINRPKKTRSAAYAALASGGEIWVAPNTQWSDGTEGLGLTAGQGMWINNGTVAATGFMTQKNCTFRGYGTTTAGPFGTQAALMLGGDVSGAGARDNPAVWFNQVGVPITFRNVAIIADQPVRMGWDYRRHSDASVYTLPITSAVRSNGGTADGQTVLTVTLTTSPIASMTRTSGVVRVTYTLNEAYPVANIGSVVRVNAGDQSATFPNGDYPVIAADTLGGSTYYFEYLEGAGSHGTVNPVGGTMATHGVSHRDSVQYGVIEITSNTIEFPATMYLTKAASSDATQIIVRDPYGGTHGRTNNPTASNIGVMRLQVRYLSATFETFDDCVLYAGVVGGERFGSGPTIDKGDIAGGAEWSWYRRCYLQGAITGGPLAEQEIARASNLFMTGVNSVGIGMYQMNMSEGGIYQPIANGNCFATYDTILQDTAINVPIFKTITMEAGTSSVKIVDASMADSQDAHPTSVDLGGVSGAVTVINSSYTGGFGTVYVAPPVIMGGNDTSQTYWTSQTKSMDQMLANGFWGNDGRVAGKRDDIQSSFGVIQHPGFSNLASTDLSTWTTTGTITVTGNQSTAGLDKADKAFKLSCTDGGSAAVYLDITTPAAVAGDRVVIGYWIKAETDMVTGQGGLLSDGVYDPASAKIPLFGQYVPFGNDGAWDWLEDIQPVTSAHTGKTVLRWKIYVAQGHDVIVYMPKLHYFSAATYSANEAARQLRVSRTVPPGLTSGSAGTMPGIKLIGQAGIGTDSANAKTVGAGSGQLTLTGTGTVYLPTYDVDGTTITGWVAQLQATVNP